MAANANISSSFSVVVVPTNTAATTVTIDRAFKVVGIYANNTTAGALTVTVTDGANPITDGAQSIGANSGDFAELVPANLDVLVTENLVVTASGTGLNPIVIECVAAGGGEPLITA